ncbi:hypothetical protein GGF32_005120 [Allomyces javanicus]|nr:hypothetical protein GGF32_005120 [Allomyces javanicus]
MLKMKTGIVSTASIACMQTTSSFPFTLKAAVGVLVTNSTAALKSLVTAAMDAVSRLFRGSRNDRVDADPPSHPSQAADADPPGKQVVERAGLVAERKERAVKCDAQHGAKGPSSLEDVRVGPGAINGDVQVARDTVDHDIIVTGNLSAGSENQLEEDELLQLLDWLRAVQETSTDANGAHSGYSADTVPARNSLADEEGECRA